MKKLILTLAIIFAIATPVFASAQGLRDASVNLQNVGGMNGEQLGVTGDLPTAIATVIRTVLALVGTIFLALTIYAGMLWMTAQGEEEKAKKARDIISMAVIGLVIVMSAYAITYFVTSKLTGSLNQQTDQAPAGMGCCGNGPALRPSTASNCMNVGDIYKDVECIRYSGCCHLPSGNQLNDFRANCLGQGERWEATDSGDCP